MVQQRLDVDDLIGKLLATGERWAYLELSAEFDPEHRCTLVALDGSTVWTDPRTEPGELLAPGPLSREKLDGLKAQIGSSAYSTQYLQRVTDDGTATIKRIWWSWHHAPHVPASSPRQAGCDEARPAVPTQTTSMRSRWRWIRRSAA